MDSPRPPGLILHLASVRWWSALAYYALTLAEGMDRLAVPSGVVATPGSPLEARASRIGLARPEWGGLLSGRPDRALAAIHRLRDAAREGAVSAVVVHTGAGHLGAALALKGRSIPLIRVRADIRRPASGPLSSWLYRHATDRILISGDFMRRGLLEGLGVDAAKVLTLPAGIDPARAGQVDRPAVRERLRSSRGWPPGTPVVGMLARFSPVKGHADVVKAARVLCDRDPSARFLVAGPDGQTGRRQVEAWAEEAGLAGRFIALDPADDAMELAAGLDVAIIASIGSEAVCRSALEYMALGIPIVATRVNVIPETVGDAGILISPGAPEEMAAAIGAILSDPALAARMGQAGLRRVRDEFDQRRVAAKALTIIEEARMERIGRA